MRYLLGDCLAIQISGEEYILQFLSPVRTRPSITWLFSIFREVIIKKSVADSIAEFAWYIKSKGMNFPEKGKTLFIVLDSEFIPGGD